MSQEKRFGKRVPMPSTVQIIRELKLLMRHDAERTEAVPDAGSLAKPAPLLPDAR